MDININNINKGLNVYLTVMSRSIYRSFVACTYFRLTAFRTWVKVKQATSISVAVTNRQAPHSFF